MKPADYQVFCISHDDERYQAFLERLPEVFDRTKVTRIIVTPETSPPPPEWWCGGAVQWAIVCAHLQCWKLAEADGKHALVFEHDAVFHPDFAARFHDFINHLPKDTDQAYLGGQLLFQEHREPLRMKRNSHVLEPLNVHRTHAYLTLNRALRRVMDFVEEPFWNCSQTIDHRLLYIQMRQDFHVYIPSTGWMCGQGEGVSAPENTVWFERWWPWTDAGKREEAEREREFRERWLRENAEKFTGETEA